MSDQETEPEDRGKPISVTATIDGHPYTFRPGELDAWTASRFLTETGTEVEKMLLKIEEDPTIVAVAQFAYLCALQSGQDPDSFEQVASRLKTGSSVEMSATFEDGPDAPEIEEEEGAAPLPPPERSDEPSEESSPVSPITSVSGSRT